MGADHHCTGGLAGDLSDDADLVEVLVRESLGRRAVDAASRHDALDLLEEPFRGLDPRVAQVVARLEVRVRLQRGLEVCLVEAREKSVHVVGVGYLGGKSRGCCFRWFHTLDPGRG